jgi:two-component system OmpR family sensor kinase
MRTIRRQLLIGLLGGALVCTVLAGIAMYMKVLEEANELFDYQLRQLATSVPTRGSSPSPMRGDPEEAVIVQVRDHAGRLVYTSAASQVLPAAPVSGYGMVAARGENWRVYVVARDNEVVQVAQAMSAREELAAGVALRSLLPFLLMLPVLAVLIYFVVGKSLLPLSRLARAVGRRSPSALQPLGVGGQPPELRPVVEALDDLLRRLDHALSSQRAFVADAAHELRSPLTALKLQLQLAERASSDDQRAVAFAKLHERLDRSTRLVQQLLTAARHESGPKDRHLEQVDLLALAQDCVADRFVYASERGIDLGVAPGGEQTFAAGKPDELQILLGNLLDNALRYTPSGGRVDVAVLAEHGHAVLQVVDTGPGIPPHERVRVFDRFYRGEGNEAWGSGLGLSIVGSIAAAHGASVRLADGEGGAGLLVKVCFGTAERGIGPDQGDGAGR